MGDIVRFPMDKVKQKCLICSNTRELLMGEALEQSLWICDECHEAIAFAKALLKQEMEVKK